MEFTKSIKEYYAAQSLIVGGVKKMNKLGPIEKFPIYFSRAKGSIVWDIDGNEYVDFISGKGATILGYANDEVNSQVVNQINMSNFMPLSNPIQNELARIINEKIPCAERVRLFRTGSCAASALIRLARAYTKKEIILTSGYHGWHDTFTGVRNGVLTENSNYTLDFQYNVNLLEKLLVKYSGSVAAIFITPELCFFGKEFYEECFHLSRKYNTLFLFDEIKTGFRTSLEGFQSKIGIIPDAATFSKAMGNGYAISAVAGFDKLMFAEEETHLSGTFDTEASSIRASISTIELLEKYNVASYIENLGRYFAEELDKLFLKKKFPAKCFYKDASAFHIIFETEDLGNEFYGESINRGILFYCFNNVNLNYSHKKHQIDDVLNKLVNVIDVLTFDKGLLTESAYKNYLIKNRFVSEYE